METVGEVCSLSHPTAVLCTFELMEWHSSFYAFLAGIEASLRALLFQRESGVQLENFQITNILSKPSCYEAGRRSRQSMRSGHSCKKVSFRRPPLTSPRCRGSPSLRPHSKVLAVRFNLHALSPDGQDLLPPRANILSPPSLILT